MGWFGADKKASDSSPAQAPPPNQPIAEAPPSDKPKCKICCACPDTKRLRDECVATNGEEHCASLIEAHKQCLRMEGFKI